MGIIKKYSFVLALALAVIYVYAPLRLEDLAKPRWLDDINVIINKSLVPARREANVSQVDPVAAANVDEDLDYRLAQRAKSVDGWRSFLAAHPDGAHAQSARAELDKLVAVEMATAPAVALASTSEPPDTKAVSVAAFPPTEVAKPTSDEFCKRDQDRLEELSNSSTSDGAMHFLTELRCEKLRPELFRLTEHLNYQDASANVAAPNVAEEGPARRRSD